MGDGSPGVPDPGHILQVGFGFWASKALLSAVELELFTVLGERSLTADELRGRLGLHERGHRDLFDALVSLGLLERDGDGPEARYANTASTGAFLDKNVGSYIGGILEMANARLYRFWADLTDALRTGRVQNESKVSDDFFGSLYEDEERLEQFLAAMPAIQAGNYRALLDRVDLSSTRTFCDLGGAGGHLCVLVAQRYPDVRVVNFDLPAVEPITKRTFAASGIEDRASTVGGDFFIDAVPPADVTVMGNVLHDWTDDEKQALISKVYESLNEGGRLIAIENVIDDARRENTFGLLMSLNMLIETQGGSDYTGAQFDEWCRRAGFARTELIPLTGPASAAIAYK